MQDNANNKQAQRESLAPTCSFSGYPLPTSNTTYVPNQFFDVLLRHNSRGCVRLVGLLIRKTLGWCDEHGNPTETAFSISHRELSRSANISRGALSAAIEEAISAGFITRTLDSKPSQKNTPHITGAYQLRWDPSPHYQKDPSQFSGFFSGQGNRTYLPNAFFDHTLRSESLSVIKTVGAIIRHTIGWQNEYGFRRQQVQLSYTDLQNITKLTPRHLSKALSTAIANNHISIIQKGNFDPNAGKNSAATIYGILWEEAPGSKRIVDKISSITPIRSKKDSGSELPGSKRIAAPQIKKDSGLVPKKSAEKRSKKDSDIEIKPKNNTTNQPPVGWNAPLAQVDEATTMAETKGTGGKSAKAGQRVNGLRGHAAAAFLRLVKEGFDKKSAKHLAESYPLERIQRQCELMTKRTVTKSRLGMLRKAIEEDWADPEAETKKKPQAQAAKTSRTIFKAKKPPAPPSAINLKTAERKLGQLTRELESRWPELLREFNQEEIRKRSEIERMPMVGAKVIESVLASFDDERQKLERMRGFVSSNTTCREETLKRLRCSSDSQPYPAELLRLSAVTSPDTND